MGVSPRQIAHTEGERVLTLLVTDPEQLWASRDDVALAVRYSLQLLRERAPGNSVEVRVPPYGAAQVVEGPRHTRGTPPAVIEVSPRQWLELVCGERDFAEAVNDGVVRASGLRTDLQAFLPLWPLS